MPTMRKRNIPMSILVRELTREELARADLHETVAHRSAVSSSALNGDFDAIAAGWWTGEGYGERQVGF